jgi:hypothetical protein
MHGIKILVQQLKWIVLTAFLMNPIFPKDDREKAVAHKIQRLYTVLEDRLNMEQVKLIAHPNGEYYDTYNAYHDLKKHVLEFTKEQLSG